MLRQRREERDRTGDRPKPDKIHELGGIEPVDFFIARECRIDGLECVACATPMGNP